MYVCLLSLRTPLGGFMVGKAVCDRSRRPALSFRLGQPHGPNHRASNWTRRKRRYVPAQAGGRILCCVMTVTAILAKGALGSSSNKQINKNIGSVFFLTPPPINTHIHKYIMPHLSESIRPTYFDKHLLNGSLEPPCDSSQGQLPCRSSFISWPD